MADEFRQSIDPATHQALLAENQRLRQEIAQLKSRLASEVVYLQGLHGNFLRLRAMICKNT